MAWHLWTKRSFRVLAAPVTLEYFPSVFFPSICFLTFQQPFFWGWMTWGQHVDSPLVDWIFSLEQPATELTESGWSNWDLSKIHLFDGKKKKFLTKWLVHYHLLHTFLFQKDHHHCTVHSMLIMILGHTCNLYCFPAGKFLESVTCKLCLGRCSVLFGHVSRPLMCRSARRVREEEDTASAWRREKFIEKSTESTCCDAMWTGCDHLLLIGPTAFRKTEICRERGVWGVCIPIAFSLILLR